jgi:hypothetical protein
MDKGNGSTSSQIRSIPERMINRFPREKTTNPDFPRAPNSRHLALHSRIPILSQTCRLSARSFVPVDTAACQAGPGTHRPGTADGADRSHPGGDSALFARRQRLRPGLLMGSPGWPVSFPPRPACSAALLLVRVGGRSAKKRHKRGAFGARIFQKLCRGWERRPEME